MAECPGGEGVAICVDDPHDAARFFSQRFGICGRTELLFLINRDFFTPLVRIAFLVLVQVTDLARGSWLLNVLLSPVI